MDIEAKQDQLHRQGVYKFSAPLCSKQNEKSMSASGTVYPTFAVSSAAEGSALGATTWALCATFWRAEVSFFNAARTLGVP